MKTMTKTTLFIVSSMAVGFGVWKILHKTTGSMDSASAVESASQEMALTGVSSAPGQELSAAESGETASSQTDATTAPFEWFPAAQSAVVEFAELSEKIFPSPDEAMRKSEILMNADLLRNVADYLLTGNDSELKDQAIDILVESLKLGSPEATLQAERIISDGQIENSRLPASVRQSMAETKGEILSEFAALSDEKEAQVPSLLPGKVSQKIWSNVKEFHDQNFRESQKELGER